MATHKFSEKPYEGPIPPLPEGATYMSTDQAANFLTKTTGKPVSVYEFRKIVARGVIKVYRHRWAVGANPRPLYLQDDLVKLAGSLQEIRGQMREELRSVRAATLAKANEALEASRKAKEPKLPFDDGKVVALERRVKVLEDELSGAGRRFLRIKEDYDALLKTLASQESLCKTVQGEILKMRREWAEFIKAAKTPVNAVSNIIAGKGGRS